MSKLALEGRYQYSLLSTLLLNPLQYFLFILNSHKTLMSWLISFYVLFTPVHSPLSRTQYRGEWGKVEQHDKGALEEDEK